MTWRVIVLSCSAAKLDRPAAALRLYTGVLWQAWRSGYPCGNPPGKTSFLVLSAEHGLVEPHVTLEPYERKLTAARVKQLRGRVIGQWRDWVSNRRDRFNPSKLAEPEPIEVAVLGGELYQQLALEAGMRVRIQIDGRPDRRGRKGIGMLRARAKAFAEHALRYCNMSPDADGLFEDWSDPYAEDDEQSRVARVRRCAARARAGSAAPQPERRDSQRCAP